MKDNFDSDDVMSLLTKIIEVQLPERKELLKDNKVGPDAPTVGQAIVKLARLLLSLNLLLGGSFVDLFPTRIPDVRYQDAST
jgi:hypothetical protein